jgi:DNA-binding response OmpR family regulator
LRVFIASNDDTFRRVASFLLRRRGFAVVESERLLLFPRARPKVEVDAILLDWADADTAASRLREWHAGAEVIVLEGDDACDKWARLIEAADGLVASRVY